MHPDELRAQLEALHRESFGWALACSDGDAARAESVLQRSYLKVLESAGTSSFQARSSFKTWFFGVVRNTAAEERRRWIWRKLRLLPQESADAVASERKPAEQSLAESELREHFRRMLGELPRRQREVLHLVFYQELTLEEAAVAMAVGIGSARTHYERGKKKLRAMLEKEQVVAETRRARA
ncbi:MAG: RNA polymerase sigma factor [Candidatus Koribacter versatilis]|uniref:RNA polymerase sigma factor n=1 Tax=Candidatus Korobacter versatilis TaxID=658062 RepID=A0A932AAC5_9BACT|nr:RNA polymerase sigma factor [Candidatus Koribacter versatilis]